MKTTSRRDWTGMLMVCLGLGIATPAVLAAPKGDSVKGNGPDRAMYQQGQKPFDTEQTAPPPSDSIKPPEQQAPPNNIQPPEPPPPPSADMNRPDAGRGRPEREAHIPDMPDMAIPDERQIEIEEPGHLAPPDIDMSQPDGHPGRIKEVFGLAPEQALLDDPDSAPFDERFGRDIREEEPIHSPQRDMIDPSKVPDGGDPLDYDRTDHAPNPDDYDRGNRQDRAIYERKMRDYVDAVREGRTWDADIGMVFGIDEEEWEAGQVGVGGGLSKPDEHYESVEYGTLENVDEDEEGVMDFTEKQDAIIEEKQRDDDPEGDDPDEMRGASMSDLGGTGNPNQKYTGGFSMPSSPNDHGWERHRAELERGGGRDGGNPGDGPDRVGDGVINVDQSIAMSPAIGTGGGEGGGEGGPGGPEYSMGDGTASAPVTDSTMSPTIGDGGKNPDGPGGPK